MKMIKKYFKCTLLSDIVLNASLATEGNMETLDYISGSNFLGIVAGENRYKKYQEDKEKKGWVYDIFHSGKVSFGDAHIAKGNAQSYAMPFTLFQEKSKQGISDHEVWINPHTNFPSSKAQWEQHRGGYFNPNKKYIKKIEKKFSLKSAQDRTERRSAEGKMFGFESLRKDQCFIFSVDFKDKITFDNYANTIETALTENNKRIGKSRTAQYGQVKIELIKEDDTPDKENKRPAIFHSASSDQKQLTIYAESNLCLFNEYGQATFQPTAEHFDILGTIDWALTKIRTYSYSPWNAHRNTTNTQRDCILKGSVIVINLDDKVEVNNLPEKVGGYQEEGLGRVIYNPTFLAFGENGLWSMELEKYSEKKEGDSDNKDNNKVATNTPLGIFLSAKKETADKEFVIGESIQDFIDDPKDLFKDVTSSQWGAIRAKAIRITDYNKLMDELFSEESGYLMKGVAAEKIWLKKSGERIKKLKEAIEQKNIQELDSKFIIKFIAKLATEMAKKVQRKKPTKKETDEVHS